MADLNELLWKLQQARAAMPGKGGPRVPKGSSFWTIKQLKRVRDSLRRMRSFSMTLPGGGGQGAGGGGGEPPAPPPPSPMPMPEGGPPNVPFPGTSQSVVSATSGGEAGGATTSTIESMTVANMAVQAATIHGLQQMAAAKKESGASTEFSNLLEGSIEEASRKLKSMEEAKKGFTRGIEQAATSSRVEGMASGASKMASQAGSFLTEAGMPELGLPLQAIGKFGEVLFDSIGKLRDWSEQLHNTNMQFAQFSAAMAMVQAKQEVRDILLSQERGNRRAQSAEYLAEGKHALNKEMAQFEDAFDRVKGYVEGALARVLAGFLETSKLGKLINKILTWLEGKTEDEASGIDLYDILKEAAKPDPNKNYGVPARFRDTDFSGEGSDF